MIQKLKLTTLVTSKRIGSSKNYFINWK